MDKIKPLSEDSNYTAVNLGRLDDLGEYSLVHPKLGTVLQGKVFLKEETKASGAEISFNRLPPHTEVGYFHTHRKNEETYIFLKGTGDFQVDGHCFPITEGSVVRVAPAGERSFRNSGDEPMIYLVVQSKAGSLEEFSYTDGTRTPGMTRW